MKRSGRWALALAFVAVLGFVAWRAASHQQQKKAAMQQTTQARELPTQVQAGEVLELQPLTLNITVPVNGVVQAVNSAVVKAYVAGQLRELQVREGDSVKKGQILARIDATEVDARWRQAQKQADAAKAQLAIAQRQQDNNLALVDKGFISRTALLTSAANLDGAQANLSAAQAATDAARKSVTDTVITSPMDGQIAQRFVQDGERVGVEAKLLEIVDGRQLEVQVQLAPADSVYVQIGQAAQLQVPGTSGANTGKDDLQPVQAQVARINPSAQTGSRTVAAYLKISETKVDSNKRTPQLRPGLFLQGLVITGQSQQLALPLTAVLTDKPQPYVQLLRQQESQDGAAKLWRVVQAPVVLGPQTPHEASTWVQIVSGLSAGDRVLVGATGGLREGTAVVIAAQAEQSSNSGAQATTKPAAGSQ
ncbi:efflux RND transporter periplasmic adaptor subunit [Comamonas sp. lk]|uniref:efflux RND transporter periplasmic adaptor subunit n=1 Tax=Comamonas sp. lk TaxID=2201272 RepID=UPI000EADFFFF|nr:efflux RND transporter periplasmic adaptor subunit [Comamonas sp. lk]